MVRTTEASWKKLAGPLEQVIEANNASTARLRKRDAQLAIHEDVMDAWVAQTRVKVDEL